MQQAGQTGGCTTLMSAHVLDKAQIPTTTGKSTFGDILGQAWRGLYTQRYSQGAARSNAAACYL